MFGYDEFLQLYEIIKVMDLVDDYFKKGKYLYLFLLLLINKILKFENYLYCFKNGILYYLVFF